jgi:hypothetical protein
MLTFDSASAGTTMISAPRRFSMLFSPRRNEETTTVPQKRDIARKAVRRIRDVVLPGLRVKFRIISENGFMSFLS